jgi:hypothetical protein
MDTFACGYEWILWNVAACGAWVALSIVRSEFIWPTLLFLVPLQVAVNLLAVNFRKQSQRMFWAFLLVLGLGLCWIFYVHFQEWWIDLIGAIPVVRTTWGIWSDRANISAEEDR